MKKRVLLCACLLVLAAPGRAAAPPPRVVVVRVYEGPGTVTLFITRGEGQSEKAEFDRGATDKKLLASSEGYYRVYQQGYTLQSTFSTPRNPDSSFTTLLFAKPAD